MDHVQNDELWSTLEALKQEGKVLHYGVAVGPANGWLAEGSAPCATATSLRCK
jgi:aryl-alcohol dehydrogenase-like predicted oxidoreductase